MGYLVNNNKAECYGCGACFQICPVQAIEMVQDSAGFLYPKIKKEKCVSCGLCQRVCIAENPLNYNVPKEVWAGYNIKCDIRKKSASGGAFDAITRSVSEDTHVFGVEWNSRSSAVHSCAKACDAYERFHKSKYIQSNTGTTYEQAKKLLNQDEQVVFIGTPCQIEGLKRYLGKTYKKLICVDLVCHGVPSSKILEKYLKDSENAKNRIIRIEFRHKELRKEKWDSKCAKLVYESGKEKIVDYDSSSFLRGFANGLFFRDSCGECLFARKERVSDLTIGDCWGIEGELSEMDVHQGISLILVNTEKGKLISEQLGKFMELYPIKLETAVLGNARLRSPDKGHKMRKEFFSQLDNVNFEKLVQKYIPKISKIRKICFAIKQRILRGK